MAWRSAAPKDVLPCTAMVAVECTSVSIHILFQVVISKGLSYYVLFLVYSYAVSTLVVLPLCFIFSRTALPFFSLYIFFKCFLLGLLGFLGNICGFRGISYHGSPTLASAISNLTPA